MMNQNRSKMITLKPNQSKMFADKNRFCVVVTARRFGKTTTFLAKLIVKALEVKGLYAYCAPTYRQAKMIAWEILINMLPMRYRVRVNLSELSVTLPNGSTIRLFGLDKAHGLLGVKLHGCIIDEYDHVKAKVYDSVIRPALSDTMGFCWFLGNPDRTKRRLRQLYDKVMISRPAGWSAYKFKAVEGGYIPDEEIENAKRELDERTFREQYEGSFEDVNGQVYYAFSLEHSVRRDLVYRLDLPLCVYWDFNVTPFTVGVAQVHKREDAFRNKYDEIHCIDEFTIDNSNTPEMCRTILAKYGQHKSGMIIYGDATAKARNTASSLSDYQIILDHFKNVPNLLFRFKSANPPIKDRLNAVNSLLKNHSGQRRLFMLPICKALITDMMTVSRKENSSEIDKSDPLLTHAADGAGYFIEFEYPVLKTFVRN